MNAPRILAICTMRNEGPHLLEWIAHHRAAGITDLLVFSNDCSDGTDALLDLLQAAGVLSHVRNVVPEGRTAQWSALRAAADHPLTRAADWIMVLDCDEFVALRAPLKGIGELIAAANGADAIVIGWRLFGHGGHALRPELPTLAAYTRAIRPGALYPALAGFFKTLYRREAFARPGVHRPRQRAGTAPVFVDGAARPLPGLAHDPGRILLWDRPGGDALVALHHYSLRSAEDFMLKRARGLPNRTGKRVDLTYWAERNFNEVEDRSIDAMRPAGDAARAALLELPGIRAAQEEARRRASRAFAAQLRDPAEARLYGRLLLCAGSQSPPPELGRRLVALWSDAARAGAAPAGDLPQEPPEGA
ncbi:glycosyltransferase family 2 protein [Profundibacterium mesophilum]|uniref:Glycosyl transferase family protein n=1 Tax=Profundibacterium mesophilum KAUST100406-0324 TaxID=1037889 RepID=A0A921NS47_9RHOB|nr:glycosyltransferase family 2 protein [Profundibacterium mesophilum]KAF0676802.1 glycosyl transferase family protein [Profundibacterium mesophilum KAUST100406-0324]